MAIIRSVIILFFLLPHHTFATDINFNLGFNRGGLNTRIEVETVHASNINLGGYIHLSPKKENKSSPGLTSIGAYLKPLMHQSPVTVFVSPGFGLHIYDTLEGDSKSLLGPIFSVGSLYFISHQISIGLETTTMWSWFGDPTGSISSHLAMLKIKFTL